MVDGIWERSVTMFPRSVHGAADDGRRGGRRVLIVVEKWLFAVAYFSTGVDLRDWTYGIWIAMNLGIGVTAWIVCLAIRGRFPGPPDPE